MSSLQDDLIPILTKFHREVFLPDLERLLTQSTDSLLHDMNEGFAGIFRRFDALHERFDRLDALADQFRTRNSRLVE